MVIAPENSKWSHFVFQLEQNVLNYLDYLSQKMDWGHGDEMFRFHSLSLAVVSLKGGTKMPSDYKADLNAFLKTNKGSVGRWETRHLSEYF